MVVDEDSPKESGNGTPNSSSDRESSGAEEANSKLVDISEQLGRQLKQYDRKNFQGHHKEGILYFVDGDLDILQVGAAMALGESKKIEQYIDRGLIFPPSREEVELWGQQKRIHFQSLVVKPWILVQKV